jgi:hypothetical protein
LQAEEKVSLNVLFQHKHSNRFEINQMASSSSMMVRSASNRTGVATGEPAHDRLYRKGLIVAARQQIAHEDYKRQESMREVFETDAIQDCTFHPRINLTSASVSGRWESSPHRACERLYELGKMQADLREERQLELKQEIDNERDRFTPRTTKEEQDLLYRRLTKMSHTARQQLRMMELQKPPPFKSAEVKATSSFYERAVKRRNEGEKLREAQRKQIEANLAEQNKKAIDVIRQRGGPSCVSGNKDCTCPGHHHNEHAEAPATSQQQRSKTPPAGGGQRKVVATSNRLLAIPAHRLQDTRFVDPNASVGSRSARGHSSTQQPSTWHADSPYFAHLAHAQQPTESSYHHAAAVSEPLKGRLSLEDLERHERLMREIERY